MLSVICNIDAESVFDRQIWHDWFEIIFVIVDAYHYPVVLHFLRSAGRKVGVDYYTRTLDILYCDFLYSNANNREALAGAVLGVLMAVNFWKCLEKRSEGQLKFQRTTQLVNDIKQAIKRAPKYQNTYRLDPEKLFKIDAVDKIVKTVMINRLEDASYDQNECPKLCTQVASEIRKKILKLGYERYKIVVAVTIIEKASQSLETSMGFMWDEDRDNYSTYTFETQTFFAYCAVIGTYYE